MADVEVVHWNPRLLRRSGKGPARYLPLGPRVNNFGDLLGPELVLRMAIAKGLTRPKGRSERRLLAVGSILHLARTGDTIWGVGLHGGVSAERHTYAELDVRAVRGPLTRDRLKARGIPVPLVFGDPGLLTARFFPEFVATPSVEAADVTVVPNLNDIAAYRPNTMGLLLPNEPLSRCLSVIANSSLVVGSSLHAIVVAESYGVPARLVCSETESELKYRDYYLGTGRGDYRVADSIEEAIDMGGEVSPSEAGWSPEPLLSAFPDDLWG